jgi:hypothetical protein
MEEHARDLEILEFLEINAWLGCAIHALNIFQHCVASWMLLRSLL